MPIIKVFTDSGKEIETFKNLFPTDISLVEFRDSIEVALYRALEEDADITTLYFMARDGDDAS